MAIKLKDIAQETGVSISTVSRILSNDTSRKSNDKTVAKVLKAAESLGYFSQKTGPKTYEQYVAPVKTYSLACILTSDHETYVSPFFSTLLAGIQSELARQEANFPHNFFVAYIKDPGFPQFLKNTKLDCAIMLGRTSLENINLLKSSIPNLLYAGVNRIGGNHMDEVICDAHHGVVCAIEYLILLGHEKIGFLGPIQKKHHVFNEHRYQGFLDAMAAHQLPIDSEHVVDTILTAPDGYDSMMTLINRKTLPTAIFCGNDTVAMGVMKALDERNIRIPQDISIIGFDNIDTIAYMKPALTTIDVPKKELGRLAVKILLDKLETDRPYPVNVDIPFNLVVRESCRDIHNG